MLQHFLVAGVNYSIVQKSMSKECVQIVNGWKPH